MATIVQMIIALLIAGFVLWALKQLIGLIPMDPFFKQIIDVLIIIVVVAIVLFYVIIPLLNMLVGVGLPHFH
jgi:hypothetical protein